MLDLTILRVPVFSTICNAAFSLRREVFIVEQHVPEDEEHDADDLTATHFVAIAEGEVVGTLRLIDKPEHIKIGRVAVSRNWRGKGIASRMMAAAMAYGHAQGQQRFFLTAQSDKIGMYEKLGFVAFGPEFEDGGMPHRAMRNYDRETAQLVD